MNVLNPSLLDIVPWRVGWCHSWALAALLQDEAVGPLLLEGLENLPGSPPYRVSDPVRFEEAVRPARADFAFTLIDGAGDHHEVAGETKTNESVNAEQLRAYEEAGRTPLLYFPASSGLMWSTSPPMSDRENRLYGPDVLSALERSGLEPEGPIQGYLDALRREADRIEIAKREQLIDAADQLRDEQLTPAEILLDCAWLAQTLEWLRQADFVGDEKLDGRIRMERNDRGIWVSKSRIRVSPDDTHVSIDVLAGIYDHKRAVAIKAGGGPKGPARERLEQYAEELGQLGFRRCAKRDRGKVATLWKAGVDDNDARATAQLVAHAARILRRAGRPVTD